MQFFRNRKGGGIINTRVNKIIPFIREVIDKKVLIGIGIGMILATIIILIFNQNTKMSDAEIEKAARGLGMHYESECKSLIKSLEGE